MNIYVDYVQHTWVEREPDPYDDWDAGDIGGTYEVTGVSLSPGFRDRFETSEDIRVGDTVYVTYVTYASGSTFGTQGGYGHVIAVTKDYGYALECEMWARRYQEQRPPGISQYRPWEGYFEHDQQFFLDSFEVRK